jgi:bile acid-CoA:amino acid N-acyltransferase
MFGGAGGLMEHRAALFAARGFATLALAYFAYEDLQESMQTGFDIAYFDEAVQYLLSRQEVRGLVKPNCHSFERFSEISVKKT